MRSLFLSALLPAIALATSSGNLPYCDVSLAIGKGTQIMKWVLAPTNSSAYTVRTSDGSVVPDPTSYVPGQLTPIHLDVLDIKYQFIGLVMYAVDSSGAAVGQWTVTPGDPYRVPATCKFTSVCHSDADLKPFHSVFYWTAPKNTGTVKFKVMIKWGEQNHGAFYIPEKELVLTEAAPKPNLIYQGKVGASCDQTCADRGLACDATATLNVLSAAALNRVINAGAPVVCRQPLLRWCGAPSSGLDGSCWYNSCKANKTSYDTLANVCSQQIGDPSAGNRICVCQNGTTKNDPAPPVDRRTTTKAFLAAPMQLDPELTLNVLDIDYNGNVTVEVSGPVDKWFALGWDGFFMKDTYSTIVAFPRRAQTTYKLPMSSTICKDRGYGTGRGYFDAQCQGATFDYCRIVGPANNSWWSCCLAGNSTNQYTAIGVYNQSTTSVGPCETKRPNYPRDYPTMQVEEQILGDHAAGTMISNSSLTVKFAQAVNGVFTIRFTRPSKTDQFDFTQYGPSKKPLKLIWAIGNGPRDATGLFDGRAHNRHVDPSSVLYVPLSPVFQDVAPKPSPTAAPPPSAAPPNSAPTPNSGDTVPPTPSNPDVAVSGGGRPSPSLGLNAILFLWTCCICFTAGGGLRTSRHQTSVLSTLIFLCFFSLLCPTHAHNWVNTPRRARISSVTKPCVVRTDPSPHIQVGPNQPFQMEWSTGHGDTPTQWTYWVAIHAKDYDKLMDISRDVTILEKYLEDAPAASIISGNKYTKVHVAPLLANNGSSYERRVNPGDPLYITRDPAMVARTLRSGDKNSTQWAYWRNMTETDKRASYFNKLYPWIEAVHKFKIWHHYPEEFDSTTFTLPARQGPGSYIYFFKWGGYQDCVDIDVQPTAVAKPYGNGVSTSNFVKIHHCEFNFVLNPATACRLMTASSAQQCLTECNNQGSCNAVQAVRLTNPSFTYSRVPNIPFKKYTRVVDDPPKFPPPEYGPCDTRNIQGRDACANLTGAMCNATALQTTNADAYVCYGLTPYRDQDFQTTEDFTVAKDAKDPRYFSTCWIKVPSVGFVNLTPTPAPPLDWRAGYSKCLNCNYLNTVRNMNASEAPNWVNGVMANTDACENCDMTADPSCPALPDPGFGSAGSCGRQIANTRKCSIACKIPLNRIWGENRTCIEGVLRGREQMCVPEDVV